MTTTRIPEQNFATRIQNLAGKWARMHANYIFTNLPMGQARSDSTMRMHRNNTMQRWTEDNCKLIVKKIANGQTIEALEAIESIHPN